MHETDGHDVLALTVRYDGAPFAGFARQPGQHTVQGVVEDALSTVLRRQVETTGAGRTDAGVHALGQVISFPLEAGDDGNLDELARSVNGLAGPSVAVSEVRRAREGFSARFDAVTREYRYRIAVGETPPVFMAPYAWWVRKPLDLERMRAASVALVGEHDFRSFCVAGSGRGKRTVRAVDRISITSERELGEDTVHVQVVGNAFLHSMVRVIVGSLVEVGVGRRPAEWLGEALDARERSAAGPTAPARGLTLWSVDYPEGTWL